MKVHVNISFKTETKWIVKIQKKPHWKIAMQLITKDCNSLQNFTANQRKNFQCGNSLSIWTIFGIKLFNLIFFWCYWTAHQKNHKRFIFYVEILELLKFYSYFSYLHCFMQLNGILQNVEILSNSFYEL